ncbi:hypothetical protein EXIGLDRAFT_424388 [Exidia glandulosa HHB12029]|uniref:Uncharacterized protein n=1 Tax=Exidia glandulosa HHB12029 TaxID=1314781 RepID=A0A165KKH0_EXIGL|nr:hypothetical protein EXIGLDRAFT_424388 [Exidia glandulosa HHB12029]
MPTISLLSRPTVSRACSFVLLASCSLVASVPSSRYRSLSPRAPSFFNTPSTSHLGFGSSALSTPSLPNSPFVQLRQPASSAQLRAGLSVDAEDVPAHRPVTTGIALGVALRDAEWLLRGLGNCRWYLYSINHSVRKVQVCQSWTPVAIK